MRTKDDWQPRAKAKLTSYFSRRSFPRVALSLVLSLTGIVGFLLSYGMLRLGIDRMSVRYPIAVLVSYAVLLGLVRLWVEIEKSRFAPEEADIEAPIDVEPRAFPYSRSHGSWFDGLDLPVDLVDGDDGCVIMIAIAAVILALTALVVSVAAASALVEEVFLDAFIVSVLYRRLRLAQKEHWLGVALRRTWFAAILTAFVLAMIGLTLENAAPGARSIGKAIQQLRAGER